MTDEVDAALEHRLTMIEQAIQAGLAETKTAIAETRMVVEDVKVEVRKTNGSVGDHERRLARLEHEDELVKQARLEMWKTVDTLDDDYKHRLAAKNDRQWLLPLLVSVPPSVLAALTLFFVLT